MKKRFFYSDNLNDPTAITFSVYGDTVKDGEFSISGRGESVSLWVGSFSDLVDFRRLIAEMQTFADDLEPLLKVNADPD